MALRKQETQENNFSQGPQIEEEIINVRRVSTKRVGGARFNFSVLSVAGDRAGRVGLALAKAKENSQAMKKSREKARRSLVNVAITKDGSIAHEVFIKRGASILLLKPAPLGAGIIAGSSVRRVLELAGIKNISVKIIGSNNPVNNAYAALKALQSLKNKL